MIIHPKNTPSTPSLRSQFALEYPKHRTRFTQYMIENRKDPKRFSRFFATRSPSEIKNLIDTLLTHILLLKFIAAEGWNNPDEVLKTVERVDFLIAQNHHHVPQQCDHFTPQLKPLFQHFNLDAPSQPLSHGKNIKIPWLRPSAVDDPPHDEFDSVFPRDAFEDLFGFLSRYPFSTCEDDTDRITPEILSTLYESSLENSHEIGAFYTPRDVVRFMCGESLNAFFESKNLAIPYRECLANHPISDVDQKALFKALQSLRVLDPATGTGAFILEMFAQILDLRMRLEPTMSRHSLCLDILKNQLFGIDIDPHAIQIAIYRTFLCCLQGEKREKIQDLQLNLIAMDAIYSDIPKNSYDIVIGNPPYGVKMTESTKKFCKTHFKHLCKRFDIYMAFFEIGLSASRNILCYITPDKWLSKSFALDFRREWMIPSMTRIFQLGRGVFQTALVDSIISIFHKEANNTLEIMTIDDKNSASLLKKIDKSTIASPYFIDAYFHPALPESVSRLERFSHRLDAFAHCEYASVNPALAYQLKAKIHSHETPSCDELKVINTGTIGKFVPKWGLKSMKYLGEKFEYPVIFRDDCLQIYGETSSKRMQSPKLILKGLNLLDVCLDLDGSFLSTVATLNIHAKNDDLLWVLAAILNASVTFDYFKAKHPSSSYCGGLLFTPEMLHQFPVPDLSDLTPWTNVIEKMRILLKNPTKEQIREIDDEVCTLLMELAMLE